MTWSTSEVAVCCSSASSRSRVSRATCLWRLAAEEVRRRVACGPLRRFSVTVLRRRALMGLPPVLMRRLIASPRLEN